MSCFAFSLITLTHIFLFQLDATLIDTNRREQYFGQNITCQDGEPCTIICDEDKSCEYSAIWCPIDSKCSITCNGWNACSDSSINCPINNSCNISCVGDITCYDMDIKWPIIEGYGNIICQGVEGGACHGVNFPIPDPNKPYILECDGHYTECAGSVIKCPTNASCDIICSGWNSCSLATINCPTNGHCNISCLAKEACSAANILWSTISTNIGTLICDTNADYVCDNVDQPPTPNPTANPTVDPTATPTNPTFDPSNYPTSQPTMQPTSIPTSARGSRECPKYFIYDAVASKCERDCGSFAIDEYLECSTTYTEDISSLETDVGTLKNTVNVDHENRIKQNKDYIDAAISNLQEQINTNYEDIDTLKTETIPDLETELKGGIDANALEIANLETETIADLRSILDNHDNRITENEECIEGLKPMSGASAMNAMNAMDGIENNNISILSENKDLLLLISALINIFVLSTSLVLCIKLNKSNKYGNVASYASDA